MLLRARVRAVAPLPVVLGSARRTCDDGADDARSTGVRLAERGGLEVVQANVSGGSDPRLLARLAEAVDANTPDAAILATQGIGTADRADELRRALTAATGRRWAFRWWGRPGRLAAAGAGQAIFFRPAILEVAEDFGELEVESLDPVTRRPIPGGRFGGVLLAWRGTRRKLAAFTGKLARHGAEAGGDRSYEVLGLKRWIDRVTARHCRVSRVVLADMGAPLGSRAHRTMLRYYSDGGAAEPSRFGREVSRADYVFWDYASGKKRRGEAFGAPAPSADFAVDRRSVSARIYVRQDAEP